ncbi:hypothetical protein [Methylocapsa palsarum]|uniref:hypothetical protein n=1 Tax=Methylocapsa palsarum TaxID=1612308 RepID=UPI003CC7AF65
MAGEDFAVCATLRHATALAQRLHHAVAAEPFQTPSGPLLVTVSIGGAVTCH